MAESKKPDPFLWLTDSRREQLAELIKNTNRSLDDLDIQLGVNLKRTDRWHRGWLIRCFLIVHLQDVLAADDRARILLIGNRVALELDNEVVLHFWKRDAGLDRDPAESLYEAAKAYESKQGGQGGSASAPTVHVQLALKGFEVEPQLLRVPELLPSVRHIGVEYICRLHRLVTFRISAEDKHGRPVAETIRPEEADRADDSVAKPALPDIELKDDKRDEGKDVQ